MGILFHNGYSQSVSIQGVINQYAAVESILAYFENDVDSVLVASLPAEFNEGDTVMLFCVQGAEIMDTEDSNAGDIDKIQLSPGKYVFLIIDEIVGNIVVFNTTLYNPGSTKPPVISPLKPGETAQLIRVPSYRQAEVTGTVTAPAWDGKKGGVVAMFVTKTLTLGDDIDVTGKGFRGASEDRNYNGLCSSTNTVLYDSAFYRTDHPEIKAGKKGEGITDTLFAYQRGRARNINGGGGGNGRLSGGGGGSNYFSGGKGGDESTSCSPGVSAPGGAGGLPFYRFGTTYYQNFNPNLPVLHVLNRWNRIFFGGGGGTGTRISGKTTTPGGDGGGIVIIIADTIAANGGRIIANGESVTTAASGSGGGGGGGGAIILDVSGYKNNVQLSAVGGNGGNTNDTYKTGPGGGGGGGIYWLAGSGVPGVSPNLVSVGKNGVHLPSGDRHGALDGGSAARMDGLEAPLQGFLFNSVPTEFWACSNLVPETIYASQPKGGDGMYHYVWVDSSSTQNTWLPVGPADTLQNLTFDTPLSDTTYFRRIVTSGLLKPDTSFRIAVYVHEAITNNVVTSDDEVCWGDAPQPFVPLGVPGKGDGSYSFKWVVHEGDGQFAPAPGGNTSPGYTAPGLQATSFFSRIVFSGACADTSTSLVATVLPALGGFNITPLADTICMNTAPSELNGGVPTGGKAGDKRYLWESSLSGTSGWTSVGITTEDYQPGPLSETIWYRRVSFSGTGLAGDACVENSNAVRILNINPVTGNTVVTPDQTVCTGIQPLLLQASGPTSGLGGGYQTTYSFRWESRTVSTGWEDADMTNTILGQNYQPVEVTGDTTWYRRVVGSGGANLDVCTDASDPVVVNVLPLITNNVVLSDDVKCQFDQLGDLTQDPAAGATPGGGATQGGNDPTRNYKWEVANGQGSPGGSWTQLSYGFEMINYTGRPGLSEEQDYWFRRIVFSGPGTGGQTQVCSDTSELIHITIHTAITNNEIDAVDSACFNSDELVQGNLPLGEPGQEPTYLWRDNLTGSPLPGSDSQDYTHLFDQKGPYQFRREVILGECEDTSNVMDITVMELPGGVLSAGLSQACEKDTLFDIALNINTLENYSIPWAIYLDDGVHTELDGPYFMDGSGPFEVTLVTNNNEPSTQYNYTLGRIVYTSATGSYACEAPSGNLDGNIPIEVFNKPNPKISVEGLEADKDSICGNSVELVVDPDFGTGFWSHDPDLYLTFDPDPTATHVTASIPRNQDAWEVERYVLSFYSEAGDCSGTDQIELHFFEQPEPAYAGKDTTIFLKNSLKMNADSATAGRGTWSVVPGKGHGDFKDVNDPKTFVFNLDKDGDNSFQWTVTNGNCVSSEHVSIVTQKEVLRYEGFSPNNDGINDVFIIQGLADPEFQPGEIRRIRFSITFFNNLGRTILKVTQDDVDQMDHDPTSIPGGLKPDELVVWDGKVNGNVVPSGTYYYAVHMEIDQVDDQDQITDTDTYDYTGYAVVQD